MAESQKGKTCKKKDENISVVTISDTLVDRLTAGKRQTPKKISGADLDAEWYKKLKCMQDHHTKIHGLSQSNFNETVNEVETNLAIATHSSRPCHAQIQDVIRCYKGCKNQTLNCASLVQKFVECVDLKKMESISRNKERFPSRQP